jgi:hypothetical protein
MIPFNSARTARPSPKTFSCPQCRTASSRGHAIERANRECVASRVPANSEGDSWRLCDSARAHPGRAGLRPRAYPRSDRAAQKLELARKDPCCPRPHPRRLAGRETPAFEAWPRTQRELKASLVTIVHIIVTKSGNLKVLRRQTALLRSHCDPGTTPNRTMGSLPLAHKACGTTACQHSKYAQVFNESKALGSAGERLRGA